MHPVCTAANPVRIVDDLRPPSHETLCLHPETMLGPLAIKDEHCVTCSTKRFALGAMLFFESVDGNDVPRAVLRKLAYPLEVGRIFLESVGEMNNLFDTNRKC